MLSCVPPGSSSDISERREAMKSVFLVALPITLSAAFMSLSAFIDAQLMRPLLSAFYGDEMLAKALYSDYSTGALTLFNLPTVLILPLATAIVPYVGCALAEGRERRAGEVTVTALKITALLSFPSALGLSALSAPVLSFVFFSDGDMAQNAGPLLAVLALAIGFSAFLTVASALLQAFKKERLPVIALGAGIAVKLLSVFPLVRAFGSLGVPLSTLAFYLVASGTCLILLLRASQIRFPLFDVIVRPFVCAALCAGMAYMSYRALSLRMEAAVALLLAVAIGGLVYLALLFLFRAVGREELSLLPFGKRFAKKK